MSLDQVTITGSELPTGDLYAYVLQSYDNTVTAFRITSGAVLASCRLIPFPPSSFAESQFVMVSGIGNQFGWTTPAITRIVAPKVMQTISIQSLCFNTADGAVFLEGNGTNQYVWRRPFADTTWQPSIGVGGSIYAGGATATGPSNLVATLGGYPLAYLDYSLVEYENNAVKIHAAATDMTALCCFMLLSRTSGLCAQLDQSNNLSYLTLTVPAGGQILDIFYKGRLLYLVEKADTTLWLYDADQGGTEIMQVGYSTFNPATAIAFSLLI